MANLQGKVAFVTGGSRGIGREISLALADAGCDVAIGYLHGADEATSVAEEIRRRGTSAIVLAGDVSDPEAARGLVEEAEGALGPVGVLVSNAGIIASKPVEQLSTEDWEHTIRVNLSSAFHVAQAVLPSMREERWRRLIFMSSVAAQLGGAIGPHYAASKAGLIGLMHGYASALAPLGITSNAIAPALIETDMIRGNAAITPAPIPLGRFGQPDEVASVAVMLAGNGFVTGQTVNVNGGWYMS